MTNVPKNTDLLVVGICGSLRKDSYTRMALKVALEGAQEFGVKTDLIDLRGYNLVFCDGNQDENAYPEDVHKLRREVAAAQGIILGTPNYHASFSGVLKNALDLMGFEAFEGKMVGLVGVSGGTKGAGLENRIKEVGRQVARFAYLHSSEKVQEFLEEWERAPENPGG